VKRLSCCPQRPWCRRHACKLGLEGIVSKRKDLPYRSGRGGHWLKIKCVQAQELVILGYVPSTAAADMVGSLVLGYYEDGKLVHAGRVGTGWSHKLSRTLRDMIEKLHAPKPTFGSPLREVLNFREEARDA
jgi:bifunctional non-homologous end joining protein LigD